MEWWEVTIVGLYYSIDNMAAAESTIGIIFEGAKGVAVGIFGGICPSILALYAIGCRMYVIERMTNYFHTIWFWLINNTSSMR